MLMVFMLKMHALSALNVLDLGYEVDFNAADPWNVSTKSQEYTTNVDNDSTMMVPTSTFVLNSRNNILRPQMLDLE